MESFHAFAKIVRLPQPAVAMPFELDRDRERRVLGIVEKLLRGALCERRERKQFVDQSVGRRFELAIGDAFGGDAPIEACVPAMRLERITISLVRVMPTIFCRRAEPPEPGIWPSFCSGNA